MSEAVDIICTWPKSRSLASYLDQLKEADERNLLINFRTANRPKKQPRHCYMVHDGFVRGYNVVHSTMYRNAWNVLDPLTGDPWPEGEYIVRHPKWHPIDPLPMKGFQGWRYFKG